jgi:hypothetical protein
MGTGDELENENHDHGEGDMPIGPKSVISLHECHPYILSVDRLNH